MVFVVFSNFLDVRIFFQNFGYSIRYILTCLWIEVDTYLIRFVSLYSMVSNIFKFSAPTITSIESSQIQNLERLLDEYRKLVSYKDNESSKVSDTETVKKLNDEKTQLTRQIQQLNQTVESLKVQLEIAASKVSIRSLFLILWSEKAVNIS